jgi:hypothetical protein
MVKLAWDHSHYWWPEDYERYEKLFGQWCELKFKNIPGLSQEEAEMRYTEAERIQVELDEIKSRCVEISNPSREIVESRERDARLEEEIVNALKANRRTEGNENPLKLAHRGPERHDKRLMRALGRPHKVFFEN